MKNALAQIAASTIAHAPVDERPEAEASPSPTGQTAEPGVTVDATTVDSQAVAAVAAAVEDAVEDAVEAALEAAVEVAVEILDIPVKKNPRSPRRISTHDAEQILDSVLDALPEPKQPGQGRSRVSRRASSAGTVRTSDSSEGSRTV